jgi:IS605 OrfB family transposase
VSIPAYFQPALQQCTGFDSADLVYYQHTGDYWLHLVVTLPGPACLQAGRPEGEEEGSSQACLQVGRQVVGVDVGISRIAVTSQNVFFEGKRVKEHARKMFRLRRRLQAKGTRSARRHLKELRWRENRFRADVNHRVSKWLVEMLPRGSVMVMEDLVDIRERVRARRKQRRELHNWPFAQFQRFVGYKAAARGISVEFADPRYTSQGCSRCGHVARSNRRGQGWFSCEKCGY